MEHLFFAADEPHETVAACKAAVLQSDWREMDALMDFVSVKTPWLGFNHDSIPLTSFDKYVEAAGYSKSDLWNANFRKSRPSIAEVHGGGIGKQIAALLQSWLYYGLLESILGRKVNVSYLTRPGTDGKKYLYSRNLHFCLQARVFAIRADPESKFEASRMIQSDVRLAHEWITRFTAWSHPSFRPKLDEEYPGFMEQLEEIVPAVVRLAEAIEQMRLFVLPNEPTLGTLTWSYPYNLAERRRSRLTRLGWCPFQIKLLEDTVNQSTVDWLVARDMGQDRTGHETCTAVACARNNIDESTYRQAHVCQDTHCPKLLPSLEQTMAILDADQIPMVCLEHLNGTPILKVVATSKTAPGDYIAFSHVWADGLGGSTEGGLNRCQAERLSMLCSTFKETSKPVHFWVDCLCIPRSDRKIYYKALVAIRDVYLNASTVLVIDKTIEECTTLSSTEELYAHIYLSAWMQRMWTYEEAVLARHVIFVLRDGFHPYRIDTKPSMRRTVSVVWQSLGAQLYRLRAADGDHLNIGHIYQAFRYRLTNAPQEEFLSVSGMLGLDTETLVKGYKGEERAKQFWLMMRWIPFNVPFLDCPKLAEPGFRWAPRTMMYPTQTTLDTEPQGQKSECTSDGLLGAYLTVTFNTVLRGSASEYGSIFYIFVRGDDGSLDAAAAAADHRAVLRLYCLESWPQPPESLEFDTVMFPSETDKSVIRAGAWVAGAAFLADTTMIDQHHQRRYRYVGRMLTERLRSHELSSGAKTIMFEGTEKASVDAEGVWSIRDVCIT